MDKKRYEQRRENLRKVMHSRSLDALLITLDANRYYLSGFELQDHQINESAGCLLITQSGQDWLCTDARYADAAKRLWDPSRIYLYGGDSARQLNRLVKEKVHGLIGFEESAMTVAFHALFSEGLSLVPASGLVERLRIIKDQEEVERVRSSVALNHNLMEWLPSIFSIHLTEEKLAWKVERFFRENGAQSLAFPSITAFGPNAALPHAIPGQALLQENTCILVDAGCRLNDYCSDQTRTFWFGDKPQDYFLETLSHVRTAQEKAIAAIRPGIKTSTVYAVARQYLESQGVASQFTHGLGHGIGLQTHEAPSLNPRDDTVLEPGMIITVEPGLYYPAWGGIRWEYMVLITEESCQIL